jgi:hypothetical protein
MWLQHVLSLSRLLYRRQLSGNGFRRGRCLSFDFYRLHSSDWHLANNFFFLDFPIYLQSVVIHSANGVLGSESG